MFRFATLEKFSQPPSKVPNSPVRVTQEGAAPMQRWHRTQHSPVHYDAMREEHTLQITVIVLWVREQIQVVSWPVVQKLSIKVVRLWLLFIINLYFNVNNEKNPVIWKENNVEYREKVCRSQYISIFPWTLESLVRGYGLCDVLEQGSTEVTVCSTPN